MATQDELGHDTLKVLGALREQSMDGYTLQSKTLLQKEDLAKSLSQLVSQALVKVAGDLNPERIGESFFSVPIDAVGYADSLLGRLPRSYR
jgi:hypothetical protein